MLFTLGRILISIFSPVNNELYSVHDRNFLVYCFLEFFELSLSNSDAIKSLYLFINHDHGYFLAQIGVHVNL